MMNKATLYNKDAKGKIRFWYICISECDCELYMEYGLLDGEIQSHTESIPDGKAGRDVDEQLQSRMNSRINKKLDMGYVYDVNKLSTRKVMTNALGLPKPMLAQRIDKVKDVDYANSFIQKKYDGHRCLITKQDGKIIAYSRNGKIIDTIGHITDSLEIDEGVVLDGELYCHGYPLNAITSWIKRKQDNTSRLVYICYDIILDYCYDKRLDTLQDIYSLNLHLIQSFYIATTYTNIREDEIPGCLDECIGDGYEGLILRQPDYVYEPGKRSKGLIKIKKFLEDDFKVIDIKQSSEGWAILRCCFNDTDQTCNEDQKIREFDVSAPGGFATKYEIWENKEKYIGRLVNVKYANLTSYGIPFHPVATRFIEKL